MIPRQSDYLTIPSDAMGVELLHVDAARRLIKLREVGLQSCSCVLHSNDDLGYLTFHHFLSQ